jgi:hypothetical protein
MREEAAVVIPVHIMNCIRGALKIAKLKDRELADFPNLRL